MRNEAYWREDKQDDYIHFCFECPEIVAAKKIGKGTIGAANASGHVRPCQKCNIAKYRINQEEEKLREIRKQEKEEEIKKAVEKERKNIAPCVVIGMFIVSVFFLIAGSYYFDDVAEENYNEGYTDGQDNKQDAVDDAYSDGYDEGYNDGYDDGYYYAYDEMSYNTETYSQDYSQIVYITNTGNKYHNWGCQYLSESCIKVTLEYALENGFEACSKCW